MYVFLDGDDIFQNDNDPMDTAHVVRNWYEEYESELEHVEWPPHSPDLNSIEHLWCVLKRQIRNRYPLLSYLKELEQVLMEE